MEDRELYKALKGLAIVYNVDEQSIIVGQEPEYWERAIKAIAKWEGEEKRGVRN